MVTYDVTPEQRDAALARLHDVRPGLTAQVVREDYTVVEDPAGPSGVHDGVLQVDRLTPGRTAVVALTVAQSAAMEYYEGLIEQLFVEGLELRGTVPFRTRPLHRFIGEAIATRAEVLSVLHLLDKPDATWEDPEMDRIYEDLRKEFDLTDRYAALELKLRSVQEALELLVDVARDRRLFALEVAITVMILLELVVNVLQLR